MNMHMQAHIGLFYFVKKNEIVYFDSFGVENIPEEIKEFIEDKNIESYFIKSNSLEAIDKTVLYLNKQNFYQVK